jgi:hypothetical protein
VPGGSSSGVGVAQEWGWGWICIMTEMIRSMLCNSTCQARGERISTSFHQARMLLRPILRSWISRVLKIGQGFRDVQQGQHRYLSRGFGAVRPLGSGSMVQVRGHSKVCKPLAVLRGFHPAHRGYMSASVLDCRTDTSGVQPW